MNTIDREISYLYADNRSFVDGIAKSPVNESEILKNIRKLLNYPPSLEGLQAFIEISTTGFLLVFSTLLLSVMAFVAYLYIPDSFKFPLFDWGRIILFCCPVVFLGYAAYSFYTVLRWFILLIRGDKLIQSKYQKLVNQGKVLTGEVTEVTTFDHWIYQRCEIYYKVASKPRIFKYIAANKTDLKNGDKIYVLVWKQIGILL